ncbi:unnamed protein product [Prunus armeniaca]
MVTIFKSYGLWTLIEEGITIPNSKKKKSTKEPSAEEDDEKMATILMKYAKALGIIQNADADLAKKAWQLLYGEYHGGDHVRSNTKSLETVELQEVITILKSQEQRFELHNINTAKKAFASFLVSPKNQNKGSNQSGSSKS